jgi:hypothetical protein
MRVNGSFSHISKRYFLFQLFGQFFLFFTGSFSEKKSHCTRENSLSGNFFAAIGNQLLAQF